MINPAIFSGRNVVIQGISGRQGRFHSQKMLEYGTTIIAGTSPHVTITDIQGIPVVQKLDQITQPIDVSMIFVPAPHAKAAIFEAIAAHVPLIVVITEGIPVHDMLQIRQRLDNSTSTLVGPNCPGVLLPAVHSLGIIPTNLSTPGDTAIVSRSGTLTYEAMSMLSLTGFGQKYVIGIGGDMVKGIGFVDCLEMFEHDPEIKRIVMIGEIGGIEEIEAAEYIKQSVTKPVYAYVAGHHAPVGVQLGHAGAILGHNQRETAKAKSEALRKAGVTVDTSLVNLIQSVR